MSGAETSPPAAAWYLLKELAPLLRPLFLAVFFCYVILPVHLRLKRRLPAVVSGAVIVFATVAALMLLSLMIYGSVVDLNEDLPSLIDRAREFTTRARGFAQEHLPPWLLSSGDADRAEAQAAERLRGVVAGLANGAADSLAEALLVGVYMIFLMLEAGRFRRRVEAGFAPERAGQVLEVVRRINEAMAGYLRAKVLASLALALPVGLVLWAFGVPFAFLWAVLAFLGNFVPYVGSLVAFVLPLLLALVELESPWQPAALAVIMLVIHQATNAFVEPAITGKAVDLSPLALLVALAFWGLCWGLTGMFLAVPLAVLFKIIFENVEATRPWTKLLTGSEAEAG